MTVLQLIAELLRLEQTKPIYLNGSETGRFTIEPITEDGTVKGYIITDIAWIEEE